MSDTHKIGTFFTGLLFGGLAGSIIALLYAPTSGKKLRRKISDKTENLIEEAEEIIETGKEKTEKIIKESRKKASGIIEDAKKKITTN